MDFLTTARMLMDLQERYPLLRHRFTENGGLVLECWVDEEVPAMFGQAAKMFEPI